DLFIREGPRLLTVDGNRAHQLALLEHRHAEIRASPRDLDGGDARRLPFEVGRLRDDVSNVHGLFGLKQATQSISRVRAWWVAPKVLAERGHSILQSLDAENRAVVPVQNAEISLAKTCRLREHSLEHGLEVAWRTADDPKDFGSRCLLLQRLAELAAARLEFALVAVPPGSQQANKAQLHWATSPGPIELTYSRTSAPPLRPAGWPGVCAPCDPARDRPWRCPRRLLYTDHCQPGCLCASRSCGA